MKHLLLALLGIISLSASAHARGYIALKGEYDISAVSDLASGASSGEADSGDGFGGGVAIGGHFFDNFRVEAEATYRRIKFDDVSLNGVLDGRESETYTGMGNLYFDIGTGTNLKPYLGAGAGAITDKDREDYSFAWQAMAGADIKFSQTASLLLGYKYLHSNDLEQGQNSYNLRSHIVEGGLKFGF